MGPVSQVGLPDPQILGGLANVDAFPQVHRLLFESGVTVTTGPISRRFRCCVMIGHDAILSEQTLLEACPRDGGKATKGQLIRESIYPGKEVTDVLIFEQPVDKASELKLELPAANFGGEGFIRIKIPASVIVK